MKRAAFLPHPADPFMFKYWLRFYNNYWRDEVDKLYICINSPIEKEIIDYMLSLVEDDPKIQTIVFHHQIEHGTAINEMLSICTQDNIVLLEDDCYIFKKGVVDGYFRMIESGEFDVIGSERFSCSDEIKTEAHHKFRIKYKSEGDTGCNFWPNLFFCRREVLLETDRKYGAIGWKAGDYYDVLDYTFREDAAGDTFVHASLQIRKHGWRIKTIPQYHGDTDDIEHYTKKKFVFDGNAPYIHVGSLSSGVHGILKDDYGRSLGKKSIEEKKESSVLPNYCNIEQERKEWERRVAFWTLFLENSDNRLPEFKQEYAKAIRRIVEQYGLREFNIKRMTRMYRTLEL